MTCVTIISNILMLVGGSAPARQLGVKSIGLSRSDRNENIDFVV